MPTLHQRYTVGFVAPLVGAWIEILLPHWYLLSLLSLLSWERGLKFFPCSATVDTSCRVAPLVGAWIEILHTHVPFFFGLPSLLSWERGLKSVKLFLLVQILRRSSRGSVD